MSIPFFLQNNGGPAAIMALGPAAWFRYGVGITHVTNSVSAWADQSGNSRDYLQGTATNQPTKESDGSITFDGVDNFLQTGAFTLDQPFTRYVLFKQITWTASDRLMDGRAAADVTMLWQTGTTPNIQMVGADFGPASTDFVLDTYAVVCQVWNGASSRLRINAGTAATGNTSTGNPTGLTLGAQASGTTRSANIQVKEEIVFASAHNAATEAIVRAYLNTVGGL